MMRPACAYPPVLQPGLQNGPDMYTTDRDSFGFGIMGQQNVGCVPNLTSSPTGNLYQLSTIGSNPTGLNGSSGGGGTGGNMLSGGPAHPGFATTVAPTSNTYSQIQIAQQQPSPYSMATDIIPSGHHLSSTNPAPFTNQQPFPHVIGPNGEKMIPQQHNIPMGRNSGMGYGGPRTSNPVGSIPSPATQQPTSAGPTTPYATMMSGPNTGLSTQQPQSQQQSPSGRMPPNHVGPNRTGVPSEVVNSRHVVSRSVSGMSDPAAGFQSPSLYVSYPGSSASQPGSGMQVPPYSIGISNPGLSMPNMVNNNLNSPNMPPLGATYASGPNVPIGATGSGSSGRATGPGTMPPGMQLTSSTYAPSQPANRLAPTGYNIPQSYPSTVSVSGTFRSQPGGPLSRPATETASPTSQLHKDSSGPGCMSSQPPPPCSSAGPSVAGSPNPGANTSSNKGPRGGGTTNQNPGMFNPSMVAAGSCLTPNSALTPPTGTGPGGMMISGPPQPMVNSINGCLTLGQDGEVKLNSVQPPDGCYIQSRPMSSSGTRDPTLSSGVPMNGPVCSTGGNDLILSSSAFPMAPTQMNVASAGMSYAPGQQMTVIPNEFDSMGTTNSPLMMMAIPASSPIPGPGGTSTLINGPVPMNVPMSGGAPAPPPYHHHHHPQQPPPPGSMINCRSSVGGSVPPGASFFGSPAAATTSLTTTTTPAMMHGAQVMPSMPDGMSNQVQPGPMDRHFLGMPGDGNVTPNGLVTAITTSIASTTIATSTPGVNLPTSTVAGGKTHPGGGATKTTARPKRTRTKNAAGTGRTSKANAKKAAAQPTSVTPSSTPDPYALNHRLQHPGVTAVRQKQPGWNMNMCSANTFPSGGMMSPTGGMPVGSCEMRTGCGSPIPFSTVPNGLLMRPNSGSNVSTANYGGNLGGTMMPVPSPNDPNARLSASPRQPPYGIQAIPVSQSQQPSQPQQYFSPGGNGPPVSSCGFYMTGAPTAGFPGQQQPSMQQRTPPSGSSLAYANAAPPGRPQPSPMHFQQHSMSQTAAPYPTGLTVRPGCGPPSSGYPPSGVVQDGVAVTSGRLASPGPGSIPVSSSTGDTDRLVCPITNGMVWGPTQIQLTDVMQQFLPEGVYVRRFEFDLTANHLQTIVGRTDLDIVVCSHLVSEPLQVCHWPSDAVQIRFNEYLLRLDRSSVHGGQSAHKVACVKQLCRPGRNQLEIAIVGLGEDPNQPTTMAKRRAASATLEMHRFAAFMAHMPALNVLLDGLQRRRPAGVSALCDILEGRTGGLAGSRPPTSSPTVAELSLICPVFRTRMRVPGRITGCEHVEAFDMEAFLRREVLWPRLNCPICGHKSPAGLDGLCIDTTILNALHLVHPSIDSILVRSDGHWRLPPPICLDLPPDMDQWQPLIGPLTEVATQAFQSQLRGSILRGPMSSVQQPIQQQQQFLPCSESINSTDGPGRNQSGPQKTSAVRAARANSTASSSDAQTPSLTPGKEAIGSPQWSSSMHSSGSPANQSFFSAAIGTTDKTVGSTVDSGISDSAASSRSQSNSRPASQPTTWGHVQSPLVEHCTSSTAGATPTMTANTTHPLPSPGSAIQDTHSQHQYPFSDPARTSPLVGSRTSASYSDGFYASQSRTTDGADPMRSNVTLKVRRSSTGSAQPLPSDSTLTDNSDFDGAPSASLPPPVEHTESACRPTQPLRWSDSAPNSSTNLAHSPCLSAPSAQQPSSLPPSPALGPRPSSTNTVNFSIPAIPGVNMNAMDRVGSSAHSPSVSSSVASAKAPPSGLSTIPKIPSDSNPGVTDVGSPSPNLLPLTAAASASMLIEDSAQQPTPGDNRTDSTQELAADSTGGSDTACTEKKLPSSLNMGLDFLLSDDQGTTGTELVNAPTSSITPDQPTTHASFVSHPLLEQQDTLVTDTNPTEWSHPSESQASSANHPMKPSLAGSNALDPEVKSSAIDPSSVPKSDVQRLTHNTKINAPCDLNEHQQQKSRDEKKETTETAIKRIKLDPSLTAGRTETTEVKPLWNSVKPEPVSVEEPSGETIATGTVSSLMDGLKADAFKNGKSINTTGLVNSNATTTTSKSDMPPIPTELDEDCACAESIRALFAQIDRLEVFLDESYVRFVESFSCT